MKVLKITVIVCFVLLFFSAWFTITTVLFPLSSAIHDVFTRDHFVKMVVQIETQESGAGRSQMVLSYCIINGKKLGVHDADEDKVEIDKFYYVWYNTKTDKVYLTDKNSLYYDAYGELVHALILVFAAIGIAILLFFTIRFIDRRVK
ncbi:hypothetical protein [Williamwhitmania taraxaci]|uniref:Uncharacterized protein n=1 Tax=Williamwhitmania taraxaci TaxID=1640674 RepID=A0A1G6IWJ8_9BACT|nr:hypothetical protein [Williamwhitmania taraxaci]SDC10858.1 hypothetical protein SAMN05216323_101749 [Williamwhitmania taraxaci]